MFASASAYVVTKSGGELSSLGSRHRIDGFTLSSYLVINLDVELDKGIKIFQCRLVEKGFAELSVEASSEIGDLSAAIIV